MMKDKGFKLFRGFADWRTNGQMDGHYIGDSRVVFATENNFYFICDKQRLCSMDVPVFAWIQNWTGIKENIN